MRENVFWVENPSAERKLKHLKKEMMLPPPPTRRSSSAPDITLDKPDECPPDPRRYLLFCSDENRCMLTLYTRHRMSDFRFFIHLPLAAEYAHVFVSYPRKRSATSARSARSLQLSGPPLSSLPRMLYRFSATSRYTLSRKGSGSGVNAAAATLSTGFLRVAATRSAAEL